MTLMIPPFSSLKLSNRPHLDRVEVGGHDDLVQGSCQPRGQLGFPLQPLWSGVVLQPRP